VDTVRVSGLSKRYRVAKGAGFGALVPARLRRRLGVRGPEVKEIWALREASFTAEAGTVLGVIGANGAGKSTLLKVLARISHPTEGRVEVRGRVVPLLELGAAMQPEATGRENVFLNAAFYGIPKPIAERRLPNIVEFAGLEDFIDTPVKRYSSGMYLRLAFSVAVNMEPNVLLADEVLAVGDLEFQERCLRRVEEAGASGLTVLFVSHDMAAVRRLCNRVIWLNSGRIVADGAPPDVIQAYERFTWDKLEPDRGEHRNEYGEIVQARLVSAGGDEVGAVRVSEEVKVAVTLRIKRPATGFRCMLLLTANGVDAFRSVQPEVVDADEPGIYTAEATIPPHLLADTLYTVKASAWLSIEGREDRNAALVLRDALTFRVWDVAEGESARGSYELPLHGVVRPKLDWSVRRERARPQQKRKHDLKSVPS
jgi:lipopolysaccharide transport system ATP-binding protein